MDKQIFAAVEVVDHEVRFIVGEFFNTRFNIIKVERVPVSGMTGSELVNAEAVTTAIHKAAENAGNTIGTKIEKVILGIPAYRVKRYPLKVNVNIDSLDGICSAHDIRLAISKATQTHIDNTLALVQPACVKYTVNGITSRRIPIGERCDHLIVDIDLLCADRQLTYALVGCVEKAGLSVMDIYLDAFATAKEAALLEQSMDQSIIVLKTERNTTSLSLVSQGKLMACDTIEAGLGNMISSISEGYQLPTETAARLLKYNTRLNLDKYSTNPVHIWALNGETTTLSEEQLMDCVKPALRNWVDEIKAKCQPILDAGKTRVIITGEGGELQGIDEVLGKALDTDVRCYVPETLGGRYSGLTSCLGLFYSYKDNLPITQNDDNSVDMEQFAKTVEYKNAKPSDSEESITKKLKLMLFEAKK